MKVDLLLLFIGKRHTVSIALPGSILDNAQSPELRTYLAGQVRINPSGAKKKADDKIYVCKI